MMDLLEIEFDEVVSTRSQPVSIGDGGMRVSPCTSSRANSSDG